MTKEYIINQKHYVYDYDKLLHDIEIAQTDTEFRDIQERLNRFHERYRYDIKGFWWFTWAVEDKTAYSMWESLQSLLLFRMNVVYDSSGKFGK